MNNTKYEINIGDILKTNLYGDVVVLRNKPAKRILIEFTESGYQREVSSSLLMQGSVLDRSVKRINPKLKMSFSDFVAKAVAMHGDRYKYDEGSFSLASQNVKITCSLHGEFEQVGSMHIKGSGCNQCGADRRGFSKRVPTVDFIKKCSGVHGGRYNYSLVDYQGMSKKVDIICDEHGTFSQNAHAHETGSGCPKCSARCGFKGSKPAFVYVLVSDDMTKVGITSKAPHLRAATISKSADRQFEVLTEYATGGYVALDTETVLLRELHARYKNPGYKFDGYTECFLDVDRAWLINRIEEELGNGR